MPTETPSPGTDPDPDPDPAAASGTQVGAATATDDTGDPAMLRLFCAIGSAGSTLTALAIGLLPPGSAEPASSPAIAWPAAGLRGTVIYACLATALLLAVASWKADVLPRRAALRWLAWLTVALVALVALGTGEGLRSVELGVFGLVICVVTVLLGRRDAVALTLASATISVAFAAAEQRGWLSSAGRAGAASSALPLAGALVLQLVLIASALAIGLVMARSAALAARRVEDREQRFRSLLEIAADVYWELDDQLRLAVVRPIGLRRSTLPAMPPMAPGLGAPPWESPNSALDETQREAHIADLRARRPFDAVRMSQRDAAGRLIHRSISGRPRFDADGRFLGYRGVGRDITRETETQRVIERSEARYRDLFERAPSPLVLHRAGRVIDANPAGAALFGFADAAAMTGCALEALYADDAGRSAMRARVEQLAGLPPGSSLPVRDFAFRSLAGRPITAQVTGVQVETAGGPATLSIFVDITERVAAEAALRESQNTLAALVDGSPDGMALTSIDTGRFVMVNESCARMLGYRVDELIGRTTVELGIWHNPVERVRFVETLAAHGQVQEMPLLFNTRSGSQVSLTVSATRIRLNGRPHQVASLRDVTETEQLRLEHAAVFRSAIVGIALVREGRFQLVNARFHAIYGWPDGSLIGQTGAVTWADPAAYAQAAREAEAEMARGRPLRVEGLMLRADGSSFWCRLQGQAVDPDDPRHGSVWLAEDITEQRRLDTELAAARDAALAASRAKSAFLANTSHEIRTPLNGLIGLAQLASHDDLAPALRQQYLRLIVDSAQSLAAIISDILDISKIEAGRLRIEALPFALRDTLSALQRSYQPLAAARGLDLRLDIDDALPDVVTGDMLRVRQIIDNFITNALKFTSRGEVRIGAHKVGPPATGRVRLHVIDTGPGIAPDTQARLFTPFTQGDDSATRRFGGTGLGLSICRELAELMGGTVGLNSRPGCGSEFWAELPLPAALEAAAPGPATVADRTVVPAVLAAAADPLAVPLPAAELAGMRVLVVEDNPVNMLIASAMLARWGADGVEAGDGAQALDAVAAATRDGRPFDVVLMDLQMPEMSGHETTRRLRAQFDAAALPIVALTAAALVDTREEARAAGMNDFLTKPIDAVRLLETLRRYRPRQRSAAGGQAGG